MGCRVIAKWCEDCQLLASGHEVGCLTAKVEAGEMTPRERQVARHQAYQVRQAHAIQAGIEDQLNSLRANGRRLRSIAVSPSTWGCLTQAAEAADWTALSDGVVGLYMGIEVTVSQVVPDGQVVALPPTYSKGQGVLDSLCTVQAKLRNLGQASSESAGKIDHYNRLLEHVHQDYAADGRAGK